MKSLLAILFVSIVSTFGTAQHDLEIIKIKNEDRSVDISVVNYSDQDYNAILKIQMEGMKLMSPISNSILVPIDSTVYIGKLIATAEQTKYSISCKAVPKASRKETILIETPDIVFYSKNGQEKSTQFRNYLKKHDIEYLEYNVTYSPKTKNKFKAMMERRSLAKKKVKLPIIIIKGEIHYSIGNMTKFIKHTMESKKDKK